MQMMFEEGTRGGMCQATYRYAKANNKYMRNYDKNKESLFLMTMLIIYMDGQCVKSYQ